VKHGDAVYVMQITPNPLDRIFVKHGKAPVSVD